MIKLLYKPAGMIANVLGGLLAGAIFKNGWRIAAREDDAPTATDASRGWHEILLAAAIEGLSSPCQGSARPRRRRGYAQADRHLAGEEASQGKLHWERTAHERQRGRDRAAAGKPGSARPGQPGPQQLLDRWIWAARTTPRSFPS
jgi:hypothetical protein